MTDFHDYETDIVNVIAHDLKLPVGAARGFIELSQQTGELTEQQEYFLGRALLALARMEQLIEGLLDYARLEAGAELDLQSTDLPKLAQDATALVEDLAKQRNITIKIEAEKKLPKVMADKQLLDHVFSNLISNAVKYNRDDGQILVRLQKHQQVIRVDVQDTGIGIPKESIPYVFDRFYRAHHNSNHRVSGTGLGLAICRAVVQIHNGNIWVESTPEEGSTFSFTLPNSRIRKPQNREHMMSPEAAGEMNDPIDDNTQEALDNIDIDSTDDRPQF